MICISNNVTSKKILATICALCTLVSMVIQALIAFGAPLGEFVLGGIYIVAPLSRRIIHIFFAVLWGVVIYAYLSYGKIIFSKIDMKVVKGLVVLNTIFTSFAIIWNFFLTNSMKETVLMGPLTIIVSICSILLILNKPIIKERL
ncbi:hypothetical protein [Anaerosporobacter sp.]|uniref:hypothetical protein n=1 Tax=Anaerosporobacter sp. TaxID=1872529 RepID=UPI00286F3ED4|nr:hypothetical protein [Anaerosporobacter sp.]